MRACAYACECLRVRACIRACVYVCCMRVRVRGHAVDGGSRMCLASNDRCFQNLRLATECSVIFLMSRATVTEPSSPLVGINMKIVHRRIRLWR